MRCAAIAIVAAVLCLIASSNAAEPKGDQAWKTIAGWFGPKPKVTVLSGCELLIGGVRCKLFGVRLPDDDVKAAQAKRFLELYMKDYGSWFSIYNAHSPVSSRDSTPLVWLKGHGNGGWAQETLVQAGLVVIDYTGFEHYTFRVPVKSGQKLFDWKRCLGDAVSWREAGKKPNVNFSWPEAHAE